MKETIQAFGSPVRINHVDCPEGEDRRRRLYIEEKPYGTVAHCFNCGGSGFIPISSLPNCSYRKKYRDDATESTSSIFSLPTDCKSNWAEWSRDARIFIAKAGISHIESAYNCIVYSESTTSLYFPLFNNVLSLPLVFKDKNPKLKGYVQKRFGPSSTKYIIKYDRDVISHSPAWIGPTCHTKTLVICEDILSGIKINRQFNSIALLRTTMDISTTHLISQFIQNDIINSIFIHLDNDNPTVRKHAKELYNKLSFICKEDTKLTIIKERKDPKNLSNTELKKLYT